MSVARHKFPQVDHDDATGELRQVYDDIRDTLRVPWVAFACRVLATFPAFLPMAWDAARVNTGTRYAEKAADSIRRNAVLPWADPPDHRANLSASGWPRDEIDKLVATLDALNYGNPKYLLLITGWSEAIQGRAPDGSGPADADPRPIPRGLPAGVEHLHLVDPNGASVEVTALFKRVTDLHFHHGPSSDYRVLAQWPDYLSRALDDAIAPVVRGEDYDRAARDLIAEARRWVRGFPSPVGIHRDALAELCTPAEIAGLTGLLFMYQRFIADVTIDIIRLKQAFDGPDAAGASAFPV